jgi:basic membrane protein A and related proteins
MKRLLASMLILLCLPLAVGALPKVAVLDITAQKDIDQSVVAPVTETIMGEIVASKAYTVLDRAYIDQVLKEKEFQLSGAVSDQQVVQAGQYLGADYVVAGKALLVSGAYFLVAKMIDVKTGAITTQSSEQAEGKALVLLGMAKRVGAALAGGGSAPAQAATPVPSAGAGAAESANGRIKAGFLFGGSGLVNGFPYRLEGARRALQERYGAWLDTVAAPDLEGSNILSTIDRLVVKDGCSVLFMSWEVDGEKLRQAALKYPQTLFVTNSAGPGERPPNIKSYGFDISPSWYILGLISGAVSKSGKVGFLSIDDRAWLMFADYFALGVKATNPKAVLYVKADSRWDPSKQIKAARGLIDQGCDVFYAVGEMPQVYDSLRSPSGKQVLAIGGDFPREAYPGLIVTGASYDWSVAFDRILLAMHEGREVPADVFIKFEDGISLFDGPRQSIDPKFADIMRAKKIKTPDMGEINAYDLVMRRVDQMRRFQFEPFTGPIKDQKGKLRLGPGERPDPIFWDGLDWLVDNVKGEYSKR